MKEYLSDVFGKEIIKELPFLKSLDYDQPILIEADTGKGKSSFILKDLCKMLRKKKCKALMLLPRTAPIQEFKNDIEKSNNTDVLTVDTYQHLLFLKDLNYDYIICDECHYFVTDSEFNKDTSKQFDMIYRSHNAQKILMSATPEPIMRIIESWIIHHYRLRDDNPVNIAAVNLLSMHNKDQIQDTVINILPTLQDKAIVFCKSAKDAYEVYSKFADNALFVCSNDNKDYSKYIDTAAYTKMLKEHKFECKYLVCTSAVDVGVSIKDEAVKDIICTFEPDNWTNIVQCIGRKRSQGEGDTVTIHLRDCNEKRLQQLIDRTERTLEHHDYFVANGKKAYHEKYYKTNDPHDIVYSEDAEGEFSKLVVDEFKAALYLYRREVLQEIKKCGDYADYLRSALTLQEDKPIMHQSKKSYNYFALQQFADSGRVFTMKDRIELFRGAGLRDPKKRMPVMNVSKQNEYMQKEGVPYVILEDTDKKDRKKIFWVIKKDSDS